MEVRIIAAALVVLAVFGVAYWLGPAGGWPFVGNSAGLIVLAAVASRK